LQEAERRLKNENSKEDSQKRHNDSLSIELNAKRRKCQSIVDETNFQQSQAIDTEKAYCTICKKEFCNKYFLKSHMSNKHGGIFEPTSTVYLGTQGSMMTHFKYDMSTKKNEVYKNNGKTDKSDDSLLPSTPSTVLSSDLLNCETLSSENLIKIDSNDKSVSSDVVYGTEDFCDLCQKHFCNKYYLRVSS
jgi:hypothetical protein